MTRLRNSYSYKNRMPKLVGLTYRQEKILVASTGRHYATMTTAYVGNTTTLGFTRWYDSPYGVILDYLAPYSNEPEQSIPGGETASTDVSGDVQQYNKIQFPNGSKTVYMAVNTKNLADAKIASSVMAANNEHMPLIVGDINTSNRQFLSRAFVHASEMKARDIIMLGGTTLISTTSGLVSNYNVIRVGGADREETETYLKNLPTQTKNPKSYDGDSNGVVIQGLSAGATKNFVNTQLVSLSQTENMDYFHAAIDRILNDISSIGSAPSKGQTPSVVLGINNGNFETYWICYFYGKSIGRAVYQYVLPNYYPTIKLSASPTSWTNGNVTVTANFTTYGGTTLSSKKWASGKQNASYFSSNGTNISDKTFVATSNGTYTVYAKDSSGNEAVNYISVTNIDKTAPNIALAASNTSWTNQNVTVTATITESQSGVSVQKWASGSQGVSYFASSGTTLDSTNKFSVSANNTYTVYVKDKAGNEIIKTINITNIDKVNPSISGDLDNSWVKGSKVVNFIGQDDLSGVSFLRLWDKDKTALIKEVAISNNVRNLSHTITTEGITYYKIAAIDKALNETISDVTVRIDNTAPVITFTQSPTAWTKGDVVVTANVADGASGVSTKKWASGNQNVSYFASSGTALASNNQFPATSNGIYTVYAKDNVGNETVKTINITNIDKTAPTITLTPSTTDWTNQNVTVTVAITEAQSGISVQKWASGNQNISYFATSGTALPTSNSFLATSNSVYTIYVKDNVGNETIKTLNITNIDKTAPTITLTPSTTNWTNQNVTVTANITENSSGISVKKWASGNRPVGYFADGGTALASNNQFSASSNSVYTVYVKDIAGNEVVKTIEITNIDKVLPSITLTPSTTEWTNKDIVITANIADDLSGIKLKKWAAGNRDLAYFTSSGTILTQSTFVATSNSVYTVYTEDLAGNKIVKTITISKIDKVSPNITGDFDNTWFKGSKTISFIAQDDLSGVKSLKLWNNDKTTVLKDGTVANNIGNLSHTITTQGITYYKIASIDNVSNEKVQDVTVRIDNTAPTSSIVVPSTTNTRTINVTLNSITDVHSGIKEVWVSEKADFSSGVTKVALTGLTTKKFDFTLEAKSTIKDNFTDRNVYIRLYDNVGNYTNYTKVVKLIPANPDIPVIKIPLDNDIYVNGEKVVLNWTYNSVNSDVGRLPQLKAEIELKHKGGGSNGSDKIYNFVLNGDIFEYDFNNLEVGTYEVKVKVYNFLEPSVFRESAVRTFRYNDFKEDGNVFTKNIELSSPIKYISVLTTYDIPNGSSIEGRIYYETLSSGEFNTAKYKTFTLTKNHDATNIMVLPNRVTKIKAEYKLRRSPTDKYMSPIIDDITILAK